jgi:hypothetical protein
LLIPRGEAVQWSCLTTLPGKSGSDLTGGDEVYDHDIVICLGGKVKKRKKKLSKEQSGTSHVVSLDEAKHILDERAERLIVGTSSQAGKPDLRGYATNSGTTS